MKQKLNIPDNFSVTERGNTLLAREDGALVAWFKLEEGLYLEVSYTPGNSPAMYVAAIRESEEELAAHIRKNCDGWTVHRCNVEGVKVLEGTVSAD